MLLGSAYGKVSLDASGVKEGVSQAKASLDQLAMAGEKIGGAMKQAGQALTVGLTLPILAAGVASVKFASDLNETRSKVSVIFGDMSANMMKWAETANTSLGLTRQAALDGAATFALFGKAANLSGDDLTKFAQQNVQFAADFASFYNTSPEDAITAIGAAYRGETEPIRRYNILLNDQIIKQKAAALGLLDLNGNLSMQNKILAVNALITEQATAATGDFARKSGGLANQSRILQAQLHDSLTLLGQNLLPMVVMIVQALNTMLGVFQKLPVPVQQGIIAFVGFLAILGPILMILGQLITAISTIAGAWPTITALLPIISTGLASIGTVITTAIIPALTAIGTTITATILPAIGSIVVAALPIILTIGLIALAFGLLWAAWQTDFLGFRTTLQQLGFIIQFYIGQGIDGAKIKMAEMGPALNQWANETKTTMEQLGFIIQYYSGLGMRMAINAVVSAGPVISGAWKTMTTNLQTAWTTFITYLNTTWQAGWNALISYLSSAVNSVLSYLANLRDSIFSYFNIDWSGIGANIINGIITGIVNGTSALIQSIIDAVTAALNAAKSALGISSPSKKFAYLGEMSGLGYMNQFAKTVDPSLVARTMSKTVQPAASNMMSQSNSYHFASGLTLRDVQRMMDERDQQLMNTFSQAFGSV